MELRRRALRTAALIFLLALAAWIVCRRMTEALPVRTARLRTGTIREVVEDRARTTLPHVVHVTMPQQGRILPVELAEGTSVAKGQVIARLEDEDLRDAYAESLSIVRAMAENVTAARAQVKASASRRDYLKWLTEAREKVYGKDGLSGQAIRETRADYLEAEMDLEGNTAQLQSSLALSSTSRLLPIFLKRILGRTVVESSIDGVVLRRHVWNVRMMQAGEPIMDLGDMRELRVTADVLTEEAVRVRPGQKVAVYGETVGGELEGRVARVEPMGFTKLSSLGVEQQRVNVIVDFADGELDRLSRDLVRTLGLEYRVRVRIVTAEKENVLLAPRSALVRGNGATWRLFVVRNGRAEALAVVPGVSDDEQVEILRTASGDLSDGDEVIVAPEESVTSGARVRATEGD
jgi:HlyD family secretion protein